MQNNNIQLNLNLINVNLMYKGIVLSLIVLLLVVCLINLVRSSPTDNKLIVVKQYSRRRRGWLLNSDLISISIICWIKCHSFLWSLNWTKFDKGLSSSSQSLVDSYWYVVILSWEEVFMYQSKLFPPTRDGRVAFSYVHRVIYR